MVPRSRLTSYLNTGETTDATGICILFSCDSRSANELFGVALFPSSAKHQRIVFPVLVYRRAKRRCLYYANVSATSRSLIGDTLFKWNSIYILREFHVRARRKFFNCTIFYGPNRVATFNPCEAYLVGIHPNPGPTCWSDSLRALYLNARSLKAIVKSVDDALNGHDKPVFLYCFYHTDIAPEPLTQLNSTLQENGESSCLILGGDFNLPELDWSEDMSAPINNGGRADHNVFCDLMGDNFLQQFISGPTHISGNKLDLLLSNWPDVIENVSTFHPRDGRFPSDHYVITFTIKLRFKRSKGSTRQVFDFKNGNLDALRKSLSRIPFQIAASENIDEHWSNWKDLFLSAVKDHVPTKTVHDTNSPPWIDGEVRHLIQKKYAALKKYRQHKTEERKQKLRALSVKTSSTL